MNAYSTLSIGLIAAIAGSALTGPVLQNQRQNQRQDQRMDVHGCWGDAHGNLEGGVFSLPIDQEAQEIIDAVKQANRGAIDNRVDIVVVGDGYTSGEMGQFHADATTVINSMFSYEPFISYEPYFRVTQVEVISPESGVDHDPTQGILRDTALDMEYWCANIERLLCVSVSKAYLAASAAPDIDQVLAIANSNKYGGAGYPSNNLGTTAGQNASAADIAIHELGHSLGDLADEYTYGGPTTYNGGELSPVNVSIFDQAQQIANSLKWYDWMGATMSGFDGPIGTYEGGNYSVFGVYRPSNNSMMRALGRPFNLVGAERLIHQIYLEVNPIDDGTPDGSVVTPSDTLWISPMQPVNHDLSIMWYLNDQLILSAIQQPTLDLSTLTIGPGEHTVRVDVIDPTPWVRDEALRTAFMSESRSFTVGSCVPMADLNGDGNLDFFDVSAFLSAFNNQQALADFNGDGSYDFFDVSAFLNAFSSGACP